MRTEDQNRSGYRLPMALRIKLSALRIISIGQLAKTTLFIVAVLLLLKYAPAMNTFANTSTLESYYAYNPDSHRDDRRSDGVPLIA